MCQHCRDSPSIQASEGVYVEPALPGKERALVSDTARAADHVCQDMSVQIAEPMCVCAYVCQALTNSYSCENHLWAEFSDVLLRRILSRRHSGTWWRFREVGPGYRRLIHVTIYTEEIEKNRSSSVQPSTYTSSWNRRWMFRCIWSEMLWFLCGCNSVWRKRAFADINI